MRNLLIVSFAACASMVLMTASAAQAQSYSRAGYQPEARIWADNDRDYFDRGDRMNVLFTVSDDAYVAVVHIDTDGSLEFLYPASPWDNEFVRGRELHSVPVRGAGSGWTVRGRSGIGYFYILASSTPLDFSSFRGRTGSPWDWGYAGRAVHGDPFFAFDQISRVLLPRYSYGGYSEDFFSYHVGGIQRYPSYACSDQYYDSGWGWSPAYSSCGQMDYFLRNDPYYYDTRRYRGDRRAYYRDYERLDPRHGFKEDPEDTGRGVTPGVRPETRGATTGRVSPPAGRTSGEVERRDPVPARGVPQRESEPTRQAAPSSRPAPESRPRSAPAPDRSTPSTDARSPSRGSTGTTTSPGRRPAPN